MWWMPCDATSVPGVNVLAARAAAWLGLMTSISPCPLATNVAAISFLARRLDSQRRAVLGVIAYAAWARRGLSRWTARRMGPRGGTRLPILLRVLRAVYRAAAGLGRLVLLGWIPLRLISGPPAR